MKKLEQAVLEAPDGYALISIDALKAWGKYDEVRNACQFPAEQAEQEPVAYDLTTREGCVALAIEKGFERRKLHNSDVEYFVCNSTILHSFVCEALAAPVRTKDLTPHEITALIREGAADGGWQGFAQRVIAADREKNRA